MLRIDFINVGDGDAILLRHTQNGTTSTILMDCGLPYVAFMQGSQRGACVDYLMREGVDQIDHLVVSHLHMDHFGGVMPVLHHIPVKQMLALYLPPREARWICPPVRESKPTVGLCDSLNIWNDTVTFAQSLGTVCKEATEGSYAAGGMQMRMYLPDAALCARQKAMFDMLYSGTIPDDDAVYAVSKERNASSLILRAEYAGRSVLLTGDSYASCWQGRGLPPCDILKLPHHGDGKSMTEALLRALAPAIAVISCQNDPTQKKDRPNMEVLSLLLQQVPMVLCTENRAFPFYPPATRPAVRIEIEADGSILCR